MGRRRYISTEISTDGDVAALAANCGVLPVLLYTWAIPHADDWGRLTGDAVQFRLTVCPGLDVTVRQIDEALQQVADAGLWERYEVDGKRCIAFPRQSFNRHQTYIPKEKRDEEGQGGSAFPPPPPRNAAKHRGTPQNTFSPSPSPSPSPSGATQPTAASLIVGADAAAVEVAVDDAPQEPREIAVACYDTLKAVGKAPDDQRWVGKAIGRIKQLTPAARAVLVAAVSWAATDGQPGYLGAWITDCDFPQLLRAYRDRNAQPRASPEEPERVAGIMRVLQAAGRLPKPLEVIADDRR